MMLTDEYPNTGHEEDTPVVVQEVPPNSPMILQETDRLKLYSTFLVCELLRSRMETLQAQSQMANMEYNTVVEKTLSQYIGPDGDVNQWNLDIQTGQLVPKEERKIQ